MKEIRLHGRGGQGVAMAAEMMAAAFVNEGKFATAFPMFGFERRGAPVAAFVRFDATPINQRPKVYRPDAVLIADPFLRNSPVVFQGLQPEARLIMNLPGDVKENPHQNLAVVGVVDATGIALKEIGRPVTNTCMLGAFARATGWLSLESILTTLEEYFQGALLARNLRSATRGFEETRVNTFTA